MILRTEKFTATTFCQMGEPNSVYSSRRAILSHTGLYRYSLHRKWGIGRKVAWIGLNPSTADGCVDDPTIRREVGFAKSWGAHEIMKLNLYAYRATKPADLWNLVEKFGIEMAIGPENDAFLRLPLEDKEVWTIVCAWGSGPTDYKSRMLHRFRVAEVYKMLANKGLQLFSLGTTGNGGPCHPLYLPKDTQLEPWSPRPLV